MLFILFAVTCFVLIDLQNIDNSYSSPTNYYSQTLLILRYFELNHFPWIYPWAIYYGLFRITRAILDRKTVVFFANAGLAGFTREDRA